MKRLMLAIVLSVIVAANAGAVVRWSYNPTSFNQIRVLNTWYPSGWTTRSVSYSYNANGCLVMTVTTYAFGIPVGSETSTLCP